MMTSIIKEGRKGEKIYLVVSIVGSLLLWKWISLWVGKPVIIPSPEETVASLIKIVRNPEFGVTIYHSLKRMFVGFSITLVVAVFLGMVSGFYKPVYYLLKPLVTTFKAVPTMAVILLAIIWLESEKAPMLVGALICFPLLYQNVVQGIENADQHLVEMAQLYKVGKLKVLKDIYLPSIRPYLLAALSTASGLNIKIVIAAEVLSQPHISIGTCFQMERANLNTAGVFAWAVIAIVIASLFDLLIKLIKNSTQGARG